MHKSTTLIIIDMQEAFPASHGAVKGVLKQIALAKKRRAGILVINFTGEGPLLKEVKKKLQNYKRIKYCRKNDDNGAGEAIRAIKAAKFNLSKLRVCGVNTGACVYQTVLGLRRLLKNNAVKIELALDACNDIAYYRKTNWKEDYTKNFNKQKLEAPIFV